MIRSQNQLPGGQQAHAQHTGPLGAHGALPVNDGGAPPHLPAVQQQQQQQAGADSEAELLALTEEEMLQFALQMSLQDLQGGGEAPVVPAAGAS